MNCYSIKDLVIKCSVSILCALLVADQLNAITTKDVEKAVRQADYDEAKAEKHEKEIQELETKIERGKQDVEEKRKNLEITSASIPLNEANIRRAENNLRKATNKVVKLKKKLEETKASAEEAKEQAEQAKQLASEVTHDRQHEAAKKDVDEATYMLEFYQNKIEELEIEERRLRAEVIAKSKLAARTGGGGRLNRWSANLNEKKADSLVEQLLHYRLKADEAEKDLQTLTERFNESQRESTASVSSPNPGVVRRSQPRPHSKK